MSFLLLFPPKTQKTQGFFQKTLDIVYRLMVLKKQKAKDKKNDNNAHNNRNLRGILLYGRQAVTEEVREI